MRFEDYLRKETEDFIATWSTALDMWEMANDEFLATMLATEEL